MDETRIAWMSAREVAAAIRAGELTSREHLEALLARIDRLDDGLNLVVTRDDEQARRAAEEADRAAGRGRWRGPLHGVAMTIKDSFQTAGLRTTSGASELAEFVPGEDAAAVARLRGAGAVIAGKTNLPLYAADVQSYNALFGQSNNPWDTARTVGGSSGGAAGALAAGFTPLELGSDIGGSIRGPASCCGVTGHKPSFGIVPGRGQIPGPPGTLTEADIAVVGPLARDVADLELALGVLAGPNEWY
ncbi:MAG TPA: amidase family protein, partial [Woeseiaceae bacterium]|nr:amidase family protein [Woeseiaceae bacterium]